MPSRRFLAPAPAPAAQGGIEAELNQAAARLLVREGHVIQPIPYDTVQTDSFNPSRSGRIALHNGRFLRAMLRSTESHNRRLGGSQQQSNTSRLPLHHDADGSVRRHNRQSTCTRLDALRSGHSQSSRSVEVELIDDSDAGILFERHSNGRPVVRGLTA